MEMTARNKFKLAGLINISDAFLGVLMVVIIIAAAFLNSDTLINYARWGSEWMELQSMKTAASSYTGLRYDGATPTSADDLISGVAAADSIDGADHKDLMSPKSGRWVNGTYNDAWGQPFSFTKDGDGDRCIISGGIDMQVGTTDDLKVYY